MNLTSFCLDLILPQKKNYFHYGRSIFMANYNPNRLMEMAKQKNILDVASSLGLELKRAGYLVGNGVEQPNSVFVSLFQYAA